MKHFYIKTFVLCFLSFASIPAFAYDCEVDGIYYDLDDNEAMVTSESWFGSNYSGNIVIPSSIQYNGKTYSVTSIGSGAFEDCYDLISVTIPNSVTSIEDNAFQFCTNLTSINIPNGLTTIESSVFASCSSLTSITIPNSVKSIDFRAFFGCSGLTTINIPESVESIGYWTFAECTGLTSIVIPSSVTTIDGRAFSGCVSLESIVVAKNNKVFDSRGNCNAIIETASNTLIQGCKNSVIPNSVKAIGNGAFFGCTGLKSITIPRSVTSIEYAFEYCSELESMIVENGNTVYDSRDNCNAIIDKATNTLIAGCKNTVIPSSVKAIGDCAFDGCSSLRSITIPSGVTAIGEDAFSGCTALESIIVENGNSAYDSRNDCNAIIETASNTLIQGCKKTVIPDGTKAIGERAFYGCTGLSVICIPNGVTNINEEAFCYCENLATVIIPSSVIRIEQDAFRGCYNLQDVFCFIENIADVAHEEAFGWTSRATLHVPTKSLLDYQTTNPWASWFGYFSTVAITEEDMQMVLPVQSLSSDKVGDNVWYTLGGLRLTSEPTKAGMYINNGKIVMKR